MTGEADDFFGEEPSEGRRAYDFGLALTLRELRRSITELNGSVNDGFHRLEGRLVSAETAIADLQQWRRITEAIARERSDATARAAEQAEKNEERHITRREYWIGILGLLLMGGAIIATILVAHISQ